MSMHIPQNRIDDEELTFAEAMYLRDRGKLPDGYPIPDAPKARNRDLPGSKTKVTPLEEQGSPTIERNGGIVEESEEDEYTEGWNNERRRIELSKRGLSVQGNKDEMIARLRRSDAKELIEGDEAEA